MLIFKQKKVNQNFAMLTKRFKKKKFLKIIHMRIELNTKKRLIELVYKDGLSILDASSILSIKYGTARNIISNYKKDDFKFVERRWGGNNTLKLTDDTLEKIEGISENNPAISIKGISSVLFNKFQIKLSIQTML